jgi:plasmid stabilization system protein ParE
MPQLILTDGALRDLDRLYRFLAEKDVRAAENAIRAVRTNFPLLLSQPGIGRSLSERPHLREWKVRFGKGAFRVVYVPEKQTVTIISIQHSLESTRTFERTR